ncbi:unnamed protein product [Ixodes persulcatus]
MLVCILDSMHSKLILYHSLQRYFINASFNIYTFCVHNQSCPFFVVFSVEVLKHTIHAPNWQKGSFTS